MNILVVGGGRMGSRIVELLSKKPENVIYLVESDHIKAKLLGRDPVKLGCPSQMPDVTVLALPTPAFRQSLLKQSSLTWKPKQYLLSVMSQINSSEIQRHFDCPVVRTFPTILPNLPSSKSFSYSSAPLKHEVDLLFGQQTWLPDEHWDREMTFYFSCGPAWLAGFYASFLKAAQADGLSSDLAEEILRSNCHGVLEMMKTQSCDAIIDAVATPGGVTRRELTYLERHSFHDLKAACQLD